MSNNEVSLYLHIPFCIKRCSYCDFTTFTDNSNEFIEKYVTQLCNEIDFYKDKKISLKTIFFGGGTPSVLKIESLEKIFNTIHNTFKVEKDIETTIEINPVNLNRSNLKKYLALGINRLSMGVQTFNEELLASINRNHSVQDIYKTYNAAREAGFKNYNLDLIFGLPQQTFKIWEETLIKAMELNPEHISLYGLDLHDNTPMYEEFNAGRVTLPQEEETIKMFEFAKDFLAKAGFIHYEISNWSKKGHQAQHNVAYWKNDNYIGVGVSAASYYNKVRFTNTKDLQAYMKITDFSNNKEPQTFQEDLEETVFMNLRLLEDGLDIEVVNERFKIDFESYYQKELGSLFKDNLLEKVGTKLRLTKEAIFISNDIFEKFIK